MSVQIESVIIGADTEKRLLLGNSHWAATISAGTSWNRLRIGARMAMDDTAANITGSPRFYFGMLASPSTGLANGPLNDACSHFVGFMCDVSTFTRVAGPPVQYDVTSQWLGKKVGTVRTLAGGAGGHRFSAAPTTNRMVSIVELEKGSPNFTLRAGLAIAAGEYSETLLISALENSTMVGASLVLGLVDLSTTLAVSEGGNGFLNSICIGWDRSASKMHVSEMFYAIYE